MDCQLRPTQHIKRSPTHAELPFLVPATTTSPGRSSPCLLPPRAAAGHEPSQVPSTLKGLVSLSGMGTIRSLLSFCKRKKPDFCRASFSGFRQRPTLPGRLQPSTIGAERLNFCVRYGNRWIPFAIVTGILCRAFGLVRFRSLFAHFFGGGRGASRTLKTAHPVLQHLATFPSRFVGLFPQSFGSSPRPISITKLRTLPHFHR